MGVAKIDRFEDIIAWQKARVMVNDIYRVTNDGKFSRDYALRDQLRRAAISVMLNIAEGFARRTDKEFARFLFIAHGSVAEVQSGLYIALDQQYLTEKAFETLYARSNEVSKIISGLIKALR
jgi:four helix bundle protein